MKVSVVALLTAAAIMPAAVNANTVSGSYNGQTWTAQNDIVGQTSTATAAAATPPGMIGDPIYWGHSPAPGYDNSKYSGVVALIMHEATGNFICSGALLADRVSILTAGHCISGGHGSITPISMTAYFYGGSDPQAVVSNPATPGVVAVNVLHYHVNPLYTGEVIDQNDIAVVRLAAPAPTFATAYGLYTGGDLTSDVYNVAGYGRRSDQGGSVGSNLGTGRLRQGTNSYDFRYGDPEFGGFDWQANVFGGTAAIDYSYVADFDNGLAANDASCVLVGICNLGTGAREVSTAGGDSGGPQFVDGKIASVTSYGLTFGTDGGDIDNSLNNSFGELNGLVPTYIHQNWISSVVPEPSDWAMLVAGFGIVGAAARRRRVVTA